MTFRQIRASAGARESREARPPGWSKSIDFDEGMRVLRDVGEETGALPELLMKISDIYDDEVDDAVNA